MSAMAVPGALRSQKKAGAQPGLGERSGMAAWDEKGGGSVPKALGARAGTVPQGLNSWVPSPLRAEVP